MRKSAPFVWGIAVPVAVALSAVALGPAAHASNKVKAKEMTCEQFLALRTADQPRVVYWFEGLSKAGNPEDAEIEIDSLDRPVALLVTECRKAPKATLWEKIKEYL